MQGSSSDPSGMLAFWALCIGLTCLGAAWKKRSIVGWILIGAVTGPIGVLLIVIISKRKPKPEPVLTQPVYDTAGVTLKVGDVITGWRGTIEILDHGIAIRRGEGRMDVLLHGLKGEKRIPFRSMTAVQLRMPGPKTAGYIQFSILGGFESARGQLDASADENTVMFMPDVAPQMMVLRDMIEKQLGEPMPRPTSIAEELGKLAELHKSGHLSDDEFAQEKRRLIR